MYGRKVQCILTSACPSVWASRQPERWKLRYAAKKYPATGGVVDLTDPAGSVVMSGALDNGRRSQAVSEVAGHGSTRVKLANDLATLRKRFSVVLITARELNGIACLPWDEVPAPKTNHVLTVRSAHSSAGGPGRGGGALCLQGGRKAQSRAIRRRVDHLYPTNSSADAPVFMGSSIRFIQATDPDHCQRSADTARELYQEGFDYASWCHARGSGDDQAQSDLFEALNPHIPEERLSVYGDGFD